MRISKTWPELLLLLWGSLMAIFVLSSCGNSGGDNPGPNPSPSGPGNNGGNGAGTRTLVTGLSVPWEILWGPDDFIWMSERGGRVSRVNPQNGERQTLLEIADTYQQGESGLLGMVLHPDFATQPFVYLVYTYSGNGGIRERLVRYRYNGSGLTDAQILLDDIPGNTYHDGSRLLITPDRYLLMSTGDAGNTNFSQDLSSLAGKILRLNLDGSIPADNPFPDSYVWSYGHRNAQGLVVHPNGRIYSSEHGPNSDDEINIITRGGNYGWPVVLGPVDSPNEQPFAQTNNVTGSILDWSPTIAPSDLVYYTSTAIPQWQNRLLMTVLKDQMLVAVALSEDGTQVTGQQRYFAGQFGRLRDICVSPDGRVFLATNGNATSSRGEHRIIEISRLE